MKEIQLFLIPAPGTKPEFLATLIPVVEDNDNDSKKQVAVETAWNEMTIKSSGKVVLEGYTRDGWAWKPSSSAVNIRVESTDGRHKLKGFVKYLGDRQKSAYGRVHGGALWIVSYIQRKMEETERMDCRFVLDMTQLKDCHLKPLVRPGGEKTTGAPNAASARPMQQPQSQPRVAGAPTSTSAAPPARKAGGGFLGGLVGAQRQTNKSMELTSKRQQQQRAMAAAASAAAGATATAATAGGGVAGGSSAEGGDASDATGNASTAVAAASAVPPPSVLRTAQQVLAEFRQSMQDKMLDFDLAEDEEILSVTVSLSEHQVGLSTEDKERVTMEILKYMVYEAVEETNEEWVAYKEPSEFLDEAVFTIYKEGAAPPDVLEEINQGELPDEVRAEQRAMTVEKQRLANQHAAQEQKRVQQQAHTQYTADHDNDDVAALNAQKRDRRTLEDYQRDKQQAKRPRA